MDSVLCSQQKDADKRLMVLYTGSFCKVGRVLKLTLQPKVNLPYIDTLCVCRWGVWGIGGGGGDLGGGAYDQGRKEL